MEFDRGALIRNRVRALCTSARRCAARDILRGKSSNAQRVQDAAIAATHDGDACVDRARCAHQRAKCAAKKLWRWVLREFNPDTIV